MPVSADPNRCKPDGSGPLLGCLVGVLLLVAFAAGAAAQTAEIQARTALRVCADPADLPFSNQAEEGFENRIAELLGRDLDLPVEYTWFPQSVGFVRNTLRARRCDVVIGISLGFELLQNTNPYYRSAYALVYRPDSGLAPTSLDDPALATLRLGVVAGTPPASLIAERGLMRQVRPYPLMVDTRFENSGQRMAEDIAKGEIDVGFLWGPLAGYYARQHEPPLTVVPLESREGEVRLDYRITMGLRFNEPDWKETLNGFIARRQGEINAILFDYGVPLLDEHGAAIPPPAATASSGTAN